MDVITKKSVVVADICNTLYDSNTTYDFIWYCMETRKLPAARNLLHKLLLQRTSPLFWGIGIVQKLINIDLFKMIVVRFLKGRTVSEVSEWADQFYQEYLETRKIAPSLALLQNYDPADVILASATLQPIASSIAAHLGITRFLSTELELKAGKYTGRILSELSGKKLAAFNHLHQGLEIEAVITDNPTDKELMHQAKKRFAVCYNKKQEQFWSVFPDIIILNVSSINYRP
jgi:phosphoserine phosphatase